jgi:hypothetical protein
MKKLTMYFALFFLVFNNSCDQSTDPAATDVYVSFVIQSTFQNDAVRLLLDNKILLDSPVTTNSIIGLAWSSGLKKLSRTIHWLSFSVVDYGVQKGYQIDVVNDTSTVLIYFNKNTNQISFQQMKGIIRGR